MCMDLGYSFVFFLIFVVLFLKKCWNRQGRLFSPVLKQTCVSLNELDQAVFVVFNMEIREKSFKTSLFL